MVEYNELNDKEKVLMEAEKGVLTSNDVSLLLDIELSFASNLLRELWGQRILTRKKTSKKGGGVKYVYELSRKGQDIVDILHKKGY